MQIRPAVRLSFGLIDSARPGPYGGGALVGVLALGVPMHVGVLTGVFPWLIPSAYRGMPSTHW